MTTKRLSHKRDSPHLHFGGLYSYTLYIVITNMTIWFQNQGRLKGKMNLAKV